MGTNTAVAETSAREGPGRILTSPAVYNAIFEFIDQPLQLYWLALRLKFL